MMIIGDPDWVIEITLELLCRPSNNYSYYFMFVQEDFEEDLDRLRA